MDFSGLSTFWQSAIVALLTLLFLALLYRLNHSRLDRISSYGQGVLGIFTVVALSIAGLVYFKEGRDSPHLDLKIMARAIRVQDTAKHPAAFITIGAVISNKGLRPWKAQCTNLDIAGIPRSFISNMPDANYEFALPSLLKNADRGAQWRRCWTRRAEIRPDVYVSNSGYMWPDTLIDAGSADTLYYELVVPCLYSAIRIVVKMSRPNDNRLTEERLITSIQEICSNKELSTTSVSGGQIN